MALLWLWHGVSTKNRALSAKKAVFLFGFFSFFVYIKGKSIFGKVCNRVMNCFMKIESWDCFTVLVVMGFVDGVFYLIKKQPEAVLWFVLRVVFIFFVRPKQLMAVFWFCSTSSKSGKLSPCLHFFS